MGFLLDDALAQAAVEDADESVGQGVSGLMVGVTAGGIGTDHTRAGSEVGVSLARS